MRLPSFTSPGATRPRRPAFVTGRAVLAALGVAAVALMVAVGLPYGIVGAMLWSARLEEWQRCRGLTRFDARVWRDLGHHLDHDGTPYARTCMVSDLLATQPLVGRSRGEVAALLGDLPKPPVPTREMTYELGPERGFISIDSELLVIRFDAAGRVTDVRLRTD